MALPASGMISMSQVATELGIAATNLSLNDSRARSLAEKPFGMISMSDFHGKSMSGPVVFTVDIRKITNSDGDSYGVVLPHGSDSTFGDISPKSLHGVPVGALSGWPDRSGTGKPLLGHFVLRGSTPWQTCTIRPSTGEVFYQTDRLSYTSGGKPVVSWTYGPPLAAWLMKYVNTTLRVVIDAS